MKNVILRKRLFTLFLLFVVFVNCTGCAVQLAKTPKSEKEQNTKREEISREESIEDLEKDVSKIRVLEETVQYTEEKTKQLQPVKEEKVIIKNEPKPQKQPQSEPVPEVKEPPNVQPEPQLQPQPELEKQPEAEEIPEQLDMSQLGEWYMSNAEYDEMVSNSQVGVGAQ